MTAQVQFCRAWSSDSSVLEEDDVNVFYEGLVKRIESRDVQLIDVREAAELAEFGQITGSTHIPCKSILSLGSKTFACIISHPRYHGQRAVSHGVIRGQQNKDTQSRNAIWDFIMFFISSTS